MSVFKRKFRVESTRAQWWDYHSEAVYYITICTKNREHFFGSIQDKTMELSQIGEVVFSEWLKTFDMRPDMNLKCGEFVIMPNHFHAIIGIGQNRFNTQPNADNNIHSPQNDGDLFHS